MRRLILTAALLVGMAVPPAWADFDAGVAAYDSGDYETAFREFKTLAEQGDAHAQFNLGYMYHKGEGVPQDDAEAVKWLSKATVQGYAGVQSLLGNMYEKGFLQDNAEAVKWYQKAAAQGNADAQFNLGVMYEEGKGVPQDYAAAVRWLSKAADQGMAVAQLRLGLRYEEGKVVPQDDAEAVRWYRLAADQGMAIAQAKLGIMYLYGKGVPQDYVTAHMWFNIAASRGEENVRKLRDIVVDIMTPDQLAEAQRLAREWKPKTE